MPDQMINPYSRVPMMSKAGVKRDGTPFDNLGYHTASKWVRWQHGRPRKMWGYKAISNAYTYPSRGCFGYTNNGSYFLNSGSSGNLEQQQFNFSGNASALVDITPSGLSLNPNNMWQLDIQYDAASGNANLIAHCAPNLANIDSDVQTPIYYGNAYTGAQLQAIIFGHGKLK